jgi:hypothetical protein
MENSFPIGRQINILHKLLKNIFTLYEDNILISREIYIVILYNTLKLIPINI